MKSAVITGATGGVGLALIRKLLKEKTEILILTRRDSARNIYIPKNELICVEYCSLEELHGYEAKGKNYDVFFHLGWANTSREMREDLTEQQKNVGYSLEAVETAHKLGCHTFIGAGSQAEYGRHNEPLRSDTLCEPETAYGVMKLGACYGTRILCERYGMRHIWPRILSGYGIFDNVDSMLIANILNALEGRTLAFSKGEQIWDFVFMDDIAEALFAIAERGKNNAIYPIGSGKAKVLKEYIEIMCRKLGVWDETALGRVPYGKKQIMYLAADISKLTSDTGWVPKVEFEEGIQRVIEFYKNWGENFRGE